MHLEYMGSMLLIETCCRIQIWVNRKTNVAKLEKDNSLDKLEPRKT